MVKDVSKFNAQNTGGLKHYLNELESHVGKELVDIKETYERMEQRILDLLRDYPAARGLISRNYGDPGARRILVKFVNRYPETFELKGIRKIRTRYMHHTIREGGYFEKGNHKITYEDFVFSFYYRGTLLHRWNLYTDTHEVIKTEHDHKLATVNQRKVIQRAIQEFNEALWRL